MKDRCARLICDALKNKFYRSYPIVSSVSINMVWKPGHLDYKIQAACHWFETTGTSLWLTNQVSSQLKDPFHQA